MAVISLQYSGNLYRLALSPLASANVFSLINTVLCVYSMLIFYYPLCGQLTSAISILCGCIVCVCAIFSMWLVALK